MAIDAEERNALAEAVAEAASAGSREFLSEDGAPQRDNQLWTALSTQMGLAGLLVPEQRGGAGAGIAETALVVEILARRLAVVPALSSVGIASALLRTVDGEAAAVLLGELASGRTTATVAWPAPDGHDITPNLPAHGDPVAGGSVVVSGRVQYVLDGLDADVVLASARCGDTGVVVAIDADDSWVRRSAMPALDLTRALASVEFTEAPAMVLAVGVDLEPAFDLALVLMAAEQVGIAQQCHDLAVAWAKERIQFDRPIGQFQAIKHQLVDLLMSVEMARSSLDVAVSASDAFLDNPTSDAARALSVAASAAKDRCGIAAMRLADESLHILGGIGFTWEHDIHLYFRRAKTLEVLLGDPAFHRQRFASLLLEEAHA